MVVEGKLRIEYTYECSMEQSSVKSHPIPPEAMKYIAAMSSDQKKLHELAIEKLGSSYFVERTRGFEEFMKRSAK
jgi:hypothetical protein